MKKYFYRLCPDWEDYSFVSEILLTVGTVFAYKGAFYRVVYYYYNDGIGRNEIGTEANPDKVEQVNCVKL